jgi:hypothetical protein
MNLSETQVKTDIAPGEMAPSRFMMPGVAAKLSRDEIAESYQACIDACRVPTGQRLVAVTPYYNPCGYWNRYYNYWEFALSLAKQGIELVTGEVVDRRGQGELRNSIKFRANSVMWHKERLVNLLVKQLPATCDRVAWVDCDLIWKHAWQNRANEILDKYPLVQLFDRIVFMDDKARRSTENARYGFARAWMECRPSYPSSNHPPGGAWAADRILFEKFGGLYDRLVSGGADCFCAGAFINAQLHNPVLAKCNRAVMEDYADYARDVGKYTRGDIGYLNEIAWHLWHGNRENKQYQERMDAMMKVNPRKHLEVSESGLYQWAGGANLDKDFKRYFQNRKEDE